MRALASRYAPWIAVGLAGTAIRLAFVLWAPGGMRGDALFYDQLALGILEGRGYLEPDGSPGILRMPGWPAFVAALYAVFGVSVRIPLIANAVLGGATVGLLGALGARLLGRRIGLLAALLYAVWPGNVYYAAVLMTETAFTFLLVLFLSLLALAGAPETRRRGPWFAAAGLVLGLCAYVKAEPLILAPVVLLYVWTIERAPGPFLRNAALTLAVTAAVLVPWSLRNHAALGRYLPLSGNGGGIAWLGNHPGATGGVDRLAESRYAREHRGATFAESVLMRNDAGWGDAAAFVRDHPAEWLAVVGRKLRITYATDSHGALYVRGMMGDRKLNRLPGRVPLDGFIPLATQRRLATAANAWWYAILACAALGATRVGSWSMPTRVLVLGPVGAWLLIHVLMTGSPRFHFPETPALALLAAAGIDRLWRARGRLEPGDAPPSAAPAPGG